MNEPPCGVLTAAMEVQGDLSKLATSMRRLRRALRQCARCPEKNCPLIQELSFAISNTLYELTEDLDL